MIYYVLLPGTRACFKSNSGREGGSLVDSTFLASLKPLPTALLIVILNHIPKLSSPDLAIKMTIHATLSTTGNPHTSRRVDDDYGGCLDMRDEEYRARLTLIAMPTKRKQESDLTHVARVSKAARTSAPSSKANKTGANTTSLNANACARRGFSSISGEAEHGDEVAKSESIPLWKSAEERTAALNAMITSATPLHAMTTSATPHLPRPSTVESSRSSLFNLAKLDTGTHPGTHTAYPLPKRPAVTIDAAAIAVADHFLATFEFSSGDMLNVEGVNRSVVEGRRLYIGNLDFAATQVDLNEFFKDYNV